MRRVRPAEAHALTCPAENDPSPDLGTLLIRLAGGQREALEPLYRATVDSAFALARAILGDAALAEDAVAQAFVQVWRTAARFDPELGTGRGWVLMIVRSRALDVRRRRAGEEKAATVEAGDGEVSAAPQCVIEEASASERSSAVARALTALSSDQRAAIECAFFQGLSHSEIASRLGAPLGTVKTRIRTALRALRGPLRVVGADAGMELPPGGIIEGVES